MSDPMLAEVLRAVNDLRGDLKGHRDELQAHITAETVDLKEMKDAAAARAKLADDRHLEILAAINHVNIVEALPKTRDGKPDVFGHRDDHETRMALSVERVAFIKDLIKGGIKTGLGLFVLWAGYALWQAFLLGPKP